MLKIKTALCISTSDLKDILSKQEGTSPSNYVYCLDDKSTEQFNFLEKKLVDRAICEEDDSLVQLIPYIIVKNKRGHILTYKRGSKGDENRLKGKLSIGFGGHIEKIKNKHLIDIIKDTAWVELEEETGLTEDSLLCHTINDDNICLIYKDDGEQVAKHHVGIILTAVIKDHVNIKGELGITDEFFWMAKCELKEIINGDLEFDLESWSEIAFVHLFE